MTTKIAFTYDISTPVGQVRFYAGDTDGTGLNRTGGDRTRTDAEIGFLLGQCNNDVRAAAVELLIARAAEYAQQAAHTEQGNLRQDYTARSSKCLEAAQALCAQILGPLKQAAPDSGMPFTSGAPDGSTVGTMDVW
ncbi:MAG TPA: hypothetical protein VFB38_19535 [Chthonomonadaceae bacterium]|nr:hypothetical protein [Chthonomonadaceae bacterium]